MIRRLRGICPDSKSVDGTFCNTVSENCWKSLSCEGGADVVGVVTPLVRGGAQVLHGDQVVELSVLLEVHEKEEVGEDGEGQIEVESERGELKERRTCTWMT